MDYLSVCSGIEAATVAWHPLGFRPIAFSQYDPDHKYRYGPDFASALLAHHYPQVPNYGDMNRFKEWPDAIFDVLVGGTPCQSFSIAGLRKGLADPRGNLALVYLAIADRYRPRWLVWENVPGVLSSKEGRDFAAFIGALAQLGYGFSWRSLDAQYVRVDGFARAVPQRRERVILVGHSSGDWRRAAAVLFDAESLRWNPAPRREARENLAATLAGGARGRGGYSHDDIPMTPVAAPLNAGGNMTCGARFPGTAADTAAEMLIPMVANPLTARMTKGVNTTMDEGVTMVAHALRAEGFDASEDGTGRGTPLVPIAFPQRLSATAHVRAEGVSPALGALNPTAVAFDMRGREGGAQFEGPHDTANIRAASGGSSKSYVAEQWAVRRLTPTECERLQGFPDDYTAIPYRGGFAADGPRYKALGNSMAVNVMRWLGQRIAMIDAM